MFSGTDHRKEYYKSAVLSLLEKLGGIAPIIQVSADGRSIKALRNPEPDINYMAFSELLRKNHLNNFDVADRIKLIDTAIKTGHVDVVTMLADKFDSDGVGDDIRIPSEHNPEHKYRPVFWLPAIVSTWGMPYENFIAMEKYIRQKFAIQDVMMIHGEAISRQHYIEGINEWKRSENARLEKAGRKNDRYIIDENDPRTNLSFGPAHTNK